MYVCIYTYCIITCKVYFTVQLANYLLVGINSKNKVEILIYKNNGVVPTKLFGNEWFSPVSILCNSELRLNSASKLVSYLGGLLLCLGSKSKFLDL